MFDFSRHDIWKAKMSSHLKTLGHLVYQASTIESFPNSSKHKKANALALKTLRASLNEDLLHVFDHYDSAFAVWSILTSPELPVIINKLRRYRRNKSDEHCLMVQGKDSLEVHSESQLDLALNEIEVLKSKNDCDDVVENNEVFVGPRLQSPVFSVFLMITKHISYLY